MIDINEDEIIYFIKIFLTLRLYLCVECPFQIIPKAEERLFEI